MLLPYLVYRLFLTATLSVDAFPLLTITQNLNIAIKKAGQGNITIRLKGFDAFMR